MSILVFAALFISFASLVSFGLIKLHVFIVIFLLVYFFQVSNDIKSLLLHVVCREYARIQIFWAIRCCLIVMVIVRSMTSDHSLSCLPCFVASFTKNIFHLGELDFSTSVGAREMEVLIASLCPGTRQSCAELAAD